MKNILTNALAWFNRLAPVPKLIAVVGVLLGLAALFSLGGDEEGQDVDVSGATAHVTAASARIEQAEKEYAAVRFRPAYERCIIAGGVVDIMNDYGDLAQKAYWRDVRDNDCTEARGL
jgi:hypothetical protein